MLLLVVHLWHPGGVHKARPCFYWVGNLTLDRGENTLTYLSRSRCYSLTNMPLPVVRYVSILGPPTLHAAPMALLGVVRFTVPVLPLHRLMAQDPGISLVCPR